MKLTGENRSTRGKPVPVSLCPPQIPHGPTRDRTRSSAVRGWRLTAWAMARPHSEFKRTPTDLPKTVTKKWLAVLSTKFIGQYVCKGTVRILTNKYKTFLGLQKVEIPFFIFVTDNYSLLSADRLWKDLSKMWTRTFIFICKITQW
jgi:hypothetical protein